MIAHAPPVAFGLRYVTGAWTVVDLVTDAPLTVRGRLLVGLPRDEAVDALALLKLLARLGTTPVAGVRELSPDA